MFYSEPIIENFISGISQEDFLRLEAIDDDEEAYKLISVLYERDFGVSPSGVGEYLIRNKFQIGTLEQNRVYIPDSLL
ncbi:MAG: hypothetical protein MK033_05165 [Candidatus Caenarcaniphilales bacterium]|nr:hypothetical protein [Candidatus Caenarcaniphilales bacterium]